jgi:hypothetical protein
MHRILVKATTFPRDGVVKGSEMTLANVPVASDRAWAIDTARRIAALHKEAGTYASIRITEVDAPSLDETI